MKGKQGLLALSLIMVLAHIAYSQQYDSPGDFETREVVLNGTRGIMITNYKGTKTEVRIPPRINNLPVLALGRDVDEFNTIMSANNGNEPEEWAFSNKHLTNVAIPDGVTIIGYAAFLNNQLISVTIPNSVTTIGAGAFTNNRLANVVIPDSVSAIGRGAFMLNQLDSVTVLSGTSMFMEEGVFYFNPVTTISFRLDGPSFANLVSRFNFLDMDNVFLSIIIDKDNVTVHQLFRDFPTLKDCYIANGQKAGTYTRDGKTRLWSKTK